MTKRDAHYHRIVFVGRTMTIRQAVILLIILLSFGALAILLERQFLQDLPGDVVERDVLKIAVVNYVRPLVGALLVLNLIGFGVLWTRQNRILKRLS